MARKETGVTAAVVTTGCRLNQAESDGLRAQLHQKGVTVVASPDAAAVCYVNTCAVTGRAERSSIQLIRQVCRVRPQPKVVVLGCLAQYAPERVRRIPGVSAVWDNSRKQRAVAAGCPWPQRSRALLKVQDGCNRRCRYCLASLLRGQSRSVPVSRVIDSFRQLVALGYQEVVLTGLNLGDYRAAGTDLAGLVAQLLALPGTFRIRFGSLEPEALGTRLLALLADPRICPHFHIPLQSGDDRVLEAMGRLPAGSVRDYAALIRRIIDLRPDACIGTDVIVGYPGEDADSFQRTRDFLDSLPVAYLHVFPYSPRPGTSASLQADSVPPAVKQERVTELRAFAVRRRRAYERRFIGHLRPAVLEAGRTALTDNYLRVHVPDVNLRPGTLFTVVIAEKRRQDAVVAADSNPRTPGVSSVDGQGVPGWLH